MTADVNREQLREVSTPGPSGWTRESHLRFRHLVDPPTVLALLDSEQAANTRAENAEAKAKQRRALWSLMRDHRDLLETELAAAQAEVEQLRGALGEARGCLLGALGYAEGLIGDGRGNRVQRIVAHEAGEIRAHMLRAAAAIDRASSPDTETPDEGSGQ